MNEKFDSADGKFDAVQPPTALEFPLALPDPAQTAATAQAAQSDGQITRLLAYGGIVIGVLGLIAGVAGWVTRPRLATARSANGAPQERGPRRVRR